MQILYSGAFVS